jgi:NitT/TauT family transport system ATP-binding protein
MSMTPMSTTLSVDHLRRSYGRDGADVAIADVDFTVRRGEFLCVVGPSGCGKTTLLKCLSGLLPPSSGEVRLGEKVIEEPPDELAMVFQDYSRSLYPWLTVEQNVELPLKARRVPRAERTDRTREALAAVGLLQASTKRPYQLSGGMQQRVAIARALAYRPEILLMDEPFASIDAQTRAELEDLTLRTWDLFGITVLFVTHDIDEAVYLSDRVVILSPSPATVAEIVDVDLPRPRDQISTKELPEFAALRGHVFRAVRNRPAGTDHPEPPEPALGAAARPGNVRT